ncbi:hypothetical protein GCM10022221_54110 [Actinocorallia aurea]
MAHKTDPGAFVGGIFFLIVAALFGGAALSWVDLAPMRYLVPSLVVGYAVVLLVRGLSRGRRDQA